MVRNYAVAVLFLSLFFAPRASAQVPFEITVQSGGNSFLVADNATLNFSVDAIGKSTALTITLTYVGATSATVQLPLIFGAQSTFSLASTGFPASLSPGQSAAFTVQFTPTVATQATGQLSVGYVEKGANSQTASTGGAIGFTLVGTVPSLVIAYSLPTNGNVITIDNGNTIGFPSTVVGSSTTATMTVVNRGSGSGLIQNISISGNSFSLISLPLLPLSVAAGSVVQFAVVYAPGQVGNDTGTLQIQFSDRTVKLGLQGTAIASVFTYQVLQGTQTSALNPGQTLTFPNTNVGDKSSLTILAKNTSSGPATIGATAISGGEFSIADGPITPITLNVGDTTSLTISFAPSQAGSAVGRLRIANDSFTLSGTAIGAQLSYSYTSGSTTSGVAPGGNIVFTPQPAGQSVTTTFTLQNTGTTAGTITGIGISGADAGAFSIPNPPSQPFSLAPGASAQFSILFLPPSTGLFTATLQVNGQQFTLSGFGNTPPPVPAYQFTGASGNPQPLSQVPIGLSLASSYPLTIDGTLTISSNTGSLPADPAVQFSTGGQVVNFTIPANTTQAIFTGGTNQINLQTGSVAGTITVTPSFMLASGVALTPTSLTVLSYTLAPGPPALLNILVTGETSTSLTLEVTGYAPTRTLSTLQFQFTARSSAPNPPSNTATVNVQANAQAWFSSTASRSFGGQFLVTVPFSITSSSSSSTTTPLSLIQSVTVTATNAAGTSNPVVISFGP